MANLFLDFDVNLEAPQGTSPDTWLRTAKPDDVFAFAGVVTQDQTLGNSDIQLSPGRKTNSTALGRSGTVAYGSIGNGQQVAVKRATYSLGAELWCTFDIKPVIVVSSGAVPAGGLAIFRWGDVQLVVKSVTLVISDYTVVFSLTNNGTEIATVTVPTLTISSWAFVKMHVKLDATTGLIDCTINSVAQSAAYTAHNTVAVNALAGTGTTNSADHIYVGPPVTNSGTLYGVGAIDNVLFDSAAFPTGRLFGERIALAGAETNVNWAAVGAGATTVMSALTNPTDSKAARGSGVAASSLLSLTSYSTVGLLTNLIGVNIYAKRPANCDATTTRKLSMGVSIAGVHTMGARAVAKTLPVTDPTAHPSLDYRVQGLFEGIYTAGITTSNLSTTKVRLLTSP